MSIEGAGSNGRVVALRLQEVGYEVVEVPPQLTVQARRRQRTQAKSDPIAALLIARIGLRESELPQIRPSGEIEDLRVLVRHRRELRSERTRLASRLHADLEQLEPGYQSRIGRLTGERNLDRARRLLGGDDRVRAQVARERVTRLRQLNRQIERITEEIGLLAATFGSGLTTIIGIAELSAAELLAEIGDVGRYRTKAQFAMANGTAPLTASSGRIDRHRLNRGGNRQLNRIIHFVGPHPDLSVAGRPGLLRAQACPGQKRTWRRSVVSSGGSQTDLRNASRLGVDVGARVGVVPTLHQR